jgi:aryl-alcohol dehydrogenase-like predicted oxidoreductase
MLKGKIKGSNGDISVSRLIMGSYTLGSYIPEEASFRILDKYFELGGRTLDTARSYSGDLKNGDSKGERTIGRFIRNNHLRDEITLITKGGYPELRDMHTSRMTPDCIRYDINTSLAVMDVDCVDLWYYHRDDESIPVGELVDEANELIEDGLTKAVGVSNWTTKRIAEANAYAEKNGKIPFVCSEIQWNMANFTREMMQDDTMLAMYPEDYDWYLKNKFPVMAYSSQAVGFFAKYPVSGMESLNPRAKVFATDQNKKRALFAAECARKIGCSPSAFALAYITNNPVDGYAVIANSSIDQLEDSMSAANLIIDQDLIRMIDAI